MALAVIYVAIGSAAIANSYVAAALVISALGD